MENKLQLVILFWLVLTIVFLAAFKLYCTWNNLSKMWSDCHKKLEESLQMALTYQDTMQVCDSAVDSLLYSLVSWSNPFYYINCSVQLIVLLIGSF